MSESQLASESWWVSEGRTLDLAAHADRMAASLELSAELVRRELWAVHDQVPDQGEWFPRLDALLVDGEVQFRGVVRPAPARHQRARVITSDNDPRTQPSVKGPDLAALGQVRAWALDQGADEALLLSDGYLAEGAYSAVVWWRGDRLCHPPVEVAHLPSTTAQWLFAAAVTEGVELVTEQARTSDLAGVELWLLSALHGVRLVTEWIQGPELEPGRHVQYWRDKWWDDQRPH